jgi:hypothetical protein
MPYYRVYLLDATEHIFEGRGIESDSDITAITIAAEAAHKFAVEVWEGARKVVYLPAEDADGAAHYFGAAGLGWQFATLFGKQEATDRLAPRTRHHSGPPSCATSAPCGSDRHQVLGDNEHFSMRTHRTLGWPWHHSSEQTCASAPIGDRWLCRFTRRVRGDHCYGQGAFPRGGTSIIRMLEDRRQASVNWAKPARASPPHRDAP